MSKEYIYDKENVGFRRKRSSVWRILRKSVVFLVLMAFMTILYYVLFALFFDTAEEKHLIEEISQYESEISDIHRQSNLISDVIEGLHHRDNAIYEELFQTSPPGMEYGYEQSLGDQYRGVEEDVLVDMVDENLDMLIPRIETIEDNFRQIIERLNDSTLVMPPMHSPLGDFSYAQIGASVGNKINPFYKVPVAHNGLDIIAHSGEPVYVVSDGVVMEVKKSRTGLGNQVAVDHGNGYVTRYAHLSDISVKKGRKVTKGTILGYVGISGNSYAPHLHYEVHRDTLVLDPVNHLFGSFGFGDFIKMKTMSVNTQQSLD